MKIVAILLVGNLASLAFAVGAFVLARSAADGWGWFIFAAVITARGLNVKGGAS